MNKKYLIFDIGGTFIKWSIISNSFKIIESSKFQFDAKNETGKKLLEKIGEHIKKVETNDLIDAIGISTAGDIDPKTSVIIGSTPNHKEYCGLNIRDELAQFTTKPIYVENDANAAALGELSQGTLKNYQNAIFFTLGTDIGGGIIINQKILRGSNGSAGEVGYLTYDNRRWGTFFSARGLMLLAEEQGYKNMSPEQLLTSKQKIIRKIVDYWYHGLAAGFASSVALLNPEIIVIGGGLSESKLLDLELIKNLMDQLLIEKHIINSYVVVNSIHGNQAAINGMCQLINNEIEKEFH